MLQQESLTREARYRRNIRDELTGDFGNGVEASSISDCGSFGLFAEN
jgi:hypothetical protein